MKQFILKQTIQPNTYSIVISRHGYKGPDGSLIPEGAKLMKDIGTCLAKFYKDPSIFGFNNIQISLPQYLYYTKVTRTYDSLVNMIKGINNPNVTINLAQQQSKDFPDIQQYQNSLIVWDHESIPYLLNKLNQTDDPNLNYFFNTLPYEYIRNTDYYGYLIILIFDGQKWTGKFVTPTDVMKCQ